MLANAKRVTIANGNEGRRAILKKTFVSVEERTWRCEERRNGGLTRAFLYPLYREHRSKDKNLVPPVTYFSESCSTKLNYRTSVGTQSLLPETSLFTLICPLLQNPTSSLPLG